MVDFVEIMPYGRRKIPNRDVLPVEGAVWLSRSVLQDVQPWEKCPVTGLTASHVSKTVRKHRRRMRSPLDDSSRAFPVPRLLLPTRRCGRTPRPDRLQPRDFSNASDNGVILSISSPLQYSTVREGSAELSGHLKRAGTEFSV